MPLIALLFEIVSMVDGSLSSSFAKQISSYQLEVHAVDCGVPPLTSSVMVSIELLDVNDSPPIFTNDNFTATIQVKKLLIYSSTFKICQK